MKRLLIITLMMAIVSVPAMACTNLIVGKKASADGSMRRTLNFQ